MGECPHQYRRDVETCSICEPEEERNAARAKVEALSKVIAQACGDIDRLKDERDADLREIQTLTRELEDMRETLHTQADVAQQRILTLEVENLRLKRLLSPVEEG